MQENKNNEFCIFRLLIFIRSTMW